jgi:hypothetical protein
MTILDDAAFIAESANILRNRIRESPEGAVGSLLFTSQGGEIATLEIPPHDNAEHVKSLLQQGRPLYAAVVNSMVFGSKYKDPETGNIVRDDTDHLLPAIHFCCASASGSLISAFSIIELKKDTAPELGQFQKVGLTDEVKQEMLYMFDPIWEHLPKVGEPTSPKKETTRQWLGAMKNYLKNKYNQGV